MALQKVANYCVALNHLLTAAYQNTLRSSRFVRFVFVDFVLSHSFIWLRSL